MSLLLLLVLSASPTQNAALRRAQQEASVLKFRQAAATLELIKNAEALTHDEVLLYFELQARAAASLGKQDDARAWFERLLELAPDFTLQGRASPRLTGPLFEARATVERQGALSLKMVPNESLGLIESVSLSLTGPVERVRNLRVSITTNQPRREVTLTREQLATPLVIKARSVEVAVVVEDARRWQLATSSHRFEATPVVMAVAPPVPPRLSPTELPASDARVVEPARSHGLRTTGHVALGLGAAAMATGIGFFALGTSATDQFQAAVAAQMNGVLPLTNAQARQLDTNVAIGRTGATFAWLGAGVLVVTGVVLWLLDGLPGPGS
ncbi:MAG: tetratricopeptide repeat protein [Myxococcales bacterium]|nr:tetratricopeptide repeat protein [Myxococcales bacterium]